MSNLDKILPHTLKEEGGFVDHPYDKGGATNKGVTQAVYDEYRVDNKLPKQSVRYITDDEAKDIYETRYWKPIHGDELPIGVAMSLFDFAVNSGVTRASKFIQRILKVPDDGIIGPKTVAAIQNADCDSLIRCLAHERLFYLKGLSNWQYFGKGWTARVYRTELTSHGMMRNV